MKTLTILSIILGLSIMAHADPNPNHYKVDVSNANSDGGLGIVSTPSDRQASIMNCEGGWQAENWYTIRCGSGHDPESSDGSTHFYVSNSLAANSTGELTITNDNVNFEHIILKCQSKNQANPMAGVTCE